MQAPAHQLIMTVLMTPDMANFAGNIHGGTILKLLDQVAYAGASRYAARYVVTVSVDQVIFRQPIHVGELVSRPSASQRAKPACADGLDDQTTPRWRKPATWSASKPNSASTSSVCSPNAGGGRCSTGGVAVSRS